MKKPMTIWFWQQGLRQLNLRFPESMQIIFLLYGQCRILTELKHTLQRKNLEVQQSSVVGLSA